MSYTDNYETELARANLNNVECLRNVWEKADEKTRGLNRLREEKERL